ncbi:MAG: hypothetical protein E7277_02930 [Lachnospiraceae bacterium]|jgi:vacuolar-type H+-ATPase subunit I/STV1|nr:hypothetical protein [Lachnospiraceae bacterium]
MWIQVQDSIYVELKLLGTSFLLGNLLMLLYGILLCLRRLVVHNRHVVAWEDGFFWVVASVSIFLLLFVMNEGQLRFYALASVALGMWLHFKVITKKILAKISIPVYNIKQIEKARRNHGSKSE